MEEAAAAAAATAEEDDGEEEEDSTAGSKEGEETGLPVLPPAPAAATGAAPASLPARVGGEEPAGDEAEVGLDLGKGSYAKSPPPLGVTKALKVLLPLLVLLLAVSIFFWVDFWCLGALVVESGHCSEWYISCSAPFMKTKQMKAAPYLLQYTEYAGATRGRRGLSSGLRPLAWLQSVV